MYFCLSFPFFSVAKIDLKLFGWLFTQKFLHNRVFWNKKYKEIKKVFRDTFWKIRHIQIQKYPQTSNQPKYGAFSLRNEFSARGLVLLFQLSCRVAPP